jgi:fructose-1,6-bisphosphatase II
MSKIAVGPAARGSIDIDASPTENIRSVAKALNKSVEDMMVIILERPRHEQLIREVRETGARITLIGDGDVSGGIATSLQGTGIDLLLGVGGAPEGVITAAALKCLGGDFQGRLQFRNDEERVRAKKMGVKDLDKAYTIEELADGDVMFCATGVTDGPLLEGVRLDPNHRARTHSIVMRSRTGTIRHIRAEHVLNRKTQ